MLFLSSAHYHHFSIFICQLKNVDESLRSVKILIWKLIQWNIPTTKHNWKLEVVKQNYPLILDLPQNQIGSDYIPKSKPQKINIYYPYQGLTESREISLTSIIFPLEGFQNESSFWNIPKRMVTCTEADIRSVFHKFHVQSRIFHFTTQRKKSYSWINFLTKWNEYASQT